MSDEDDDEDYEFWGGPATKQVSPVSQIEDIVYLAKLREECDYWLNS